MQTKVCAAFCGTGKTYICEKIVPSAVEVEYWKYGDKEEYINDVKKYFGHVPYIFTSTNPEDLKLLHQYNFSIILIYPENSLREEYLNRYIHRDSSVDFIGAFMKYWNIWINELKEQKYCQHVVLKKGEYLSNVLSRLCSTSS